MKYSRWTLTVLLILLLSSCNLFLSPPRMRENVNDPNRQLTAFTAVPVSKSSIVTMWNWKPAQNWADPDERIEEIKIVHSTLGFVEVSIPFVGETFTDNSKWQFTWPDLAPDTTHYFSLFMRDANGRWHPPYNVKVVLPGIFKTSTFGFLASLQVKDSGSPPYISSKTNYIVVQNNGPPNFVHVVQLDIPQHISVVKATISTAGQGAAEGMYTPQDLRVFPIVREWNSDVSSTDGFAQLNDNTRSDYAVDDTVSAFFDKTANTVNDVTEVVRRAVVSGTNEILFRFAGTGSTSTNSIGSSFVVIEYYSD